MFQAILAAALELPAYHRDVETQAERLERLTTIAESIDLASARATCAGEPAGCRRVWPGSRKELAALLLEQAWSETKLAKHVHADECGPKECDRGKAKTLWQLHASNFVPRTVWQELGGTDAESTNGAAWYAAKVLASQRFRCAKDQADWVTPTIAGYARGNACEWAGAAERAKLFWRILGKL